MSKKVVYLIRHSEQLRTNGIKNINEDDQINNEKVILTVNGEKKAEELANIDELQNIDVLWSSNYVRAISTAKYMAYKNNIEINIDSRLNERKLGNLDKLIELGKDKKLTFTEEQLLDVNLKNVDGESLNEVNKRMKLFFNDILNENKSKRIAVVSHGMAIKSLLMDWCKLNEDLELIYDDRIVIDVKSPSVLKLVFNNGILKDLSIIFN